MNKGIILLGSSNSHGDTFEMASIVSEKLTWPMIDLKSKEIAAFDYAFKNSGDDFLPMMRDIVSKYDGIVLATPVYWYTMSGTMKMFFDRLSDLLKIDKDTGRKLRRMEMAVISCGSDRDLKEGFHMPFRESANYLGMHYVANVHCWKEGTTIPDVVQHNLNTFMDQLTWTS